MIELKHISKVFPTPDGALQALRDIDLTIQDGDVFGIVGMSGAGKSTLVRCINLLERPTQGQVLIDGRDLCAMPEKTYVETVAQLLAQAAPNGQGEVILNPQVSASMGPAIVERANALIGGGKLTLSKTAREIRGGFILKCGNVEVNGTFETLVRLQRTQNAGAVAKQLFPEA